MPIKDILSKVQPGLLLHRIARGNDINETRQDISPNEEFLQVSTFSLEYRKTFRPHQHIPCNKHVTITQECWIVLAGHVRVSYYDIDGSYIEDVVLGSHDITVTFRGGHTYESLSDDTKIYEIKTGPYNGQSADKVFIKDHRE